jgi:hypothetical protein
MPVAFCSGIDSCLFRSARCSAGPSETFAPAYRLTRRKNGRFDGANFTQQNRTVKQMVQAASPCLYWQMAMANKCFRLTNSSSSETLNSRRLQSIRDAESHPSQFENPPLGCYKSILRHALNLAYIWQKHRVCREGVPGAWHGCFSVLDKEPLSSPTDAGALRLCLGTVARRSTGERCGVRQQLVCEISA